MLNLSALPRFVWGPLFGLFVACNSQGGAPATEPPADLAHSPSRDAGDPGGNPDQGRSSIVSYLKQLPASTNVDIVRALAVDPSGNLFVGCTFSAPTDFGDGLRTPRGNHDVAIVKLNPSGEFLWVRHFGSPEEDTVLRLVSDAAGNVILTGNFSTTLDFGAGPVNTHGKTDFYLAKYSPEGRLVYGKAIGSSEFEFGRAGLAVDPSGNAYLTGTYGIVSGSTAAIDLGGGPLVPNGACDGFVAGFDPSGGHLFSKNFGGKYVDYFTDLTLAKNGDIVVGGSAMGTVDFGGGPIVPAAGATTWAFVLGLSPTGAYKWATSYLSDGSIVYQLASDPAGRIGVAGTFALSLQTRTASLSSSNTGLHSFILQLDENAKELWARAVTPASDYDYAQVLLADGEGLQLGGGVYGPADFGLGMRNAPKGEGFFIRYGATGTPISLRQYGGDSFTSVYSAAQTPDALYIAGSFEGTVNFEGTSLTSKGLGDGFILKLNRGFVP
ncbi:hypothetical protein [Haliangium sp. UPWRP_2]|uniref:hypothetical protein n=1 Tax=Haliangium sp. UPWRP_2 TaxID=1931276 RepID=UPI000B53E3AC|nr:hypothetical protein [Haliangium sp. UPWRP_2]PSM32290.1 hypothetical protein BVG81_001065 [Haliangium sp. UPWRP_2]